MPAGGAHLESFGNRASSRARRAGSGRECRCSRSSAAGRPRASAPPPRTRRRRQRPALPRRRCLGRPASSSASSLGELIEASALLACQPLPAGDRVAIVSNAGGIGGWPPTRAQTTASRSRAFPRQRDVGCVGCCGAAPRCPGRCATAADGERRDLPGVPGGRCRRRRSRRRARRGGPHGHRRPADGRHHALRSPNPSPSCSSTRPSPCGCCGDDGSGTGQRAAATGQGKAATGQGSAATYHGRRPRPSAAGPRTRTPKAPRRALGHAVRYRAWLDRAARHGPRVARAARGRRPGAARRVPGP